MHVEVTGLPASKDFDFFVIQLPNAPFGISWYQGDIETDSNGRGIADYVGRFSMRCGRQFESCHAPVHTYHVGLWFNNPADAADVGCPNSVTPFNGNHTAGVQALSTRNFSATTGPLKRIQ